MSRGGEDYDGRDQHFFVGGFLIVVGLLAFVFGLGAGTVAGGLGTIAPRTPEWIIMVWAGVLASPFLFGGGFYIWMAFHYEAEGVPEDRPDQPPE